MCGINGFNWPDEKLIKQMNLAVKNRGPDGEGIYIGPLVSLGHRRLSIIDLSEKGKQPMCNEDGTIWLTFNGEIYNFNEVKKELVGKGHIFTSATDSEVIIHAYEEFGIECTKRFNGMWAFCLYDSKRNKLILSRDRFGIKPLYYYRDNDRFIFSSMISGILCHNITTTPNNTAIMEYLAFNLLQHDEYTFFNQIYSLTPGTTLVYELDSKQLTKHRYYKITPQIPQDKNTIADIFTRSVELRTISDVPIGSCLSGGIDSSAIVCILGRYLKSRFNTFSLVVPGSPQDESKYIAEIGRHVDVNQYFTKVETSNFLDNVYDFVECQEEPVRGITSYAQYKVMELAHEKGMKVLLDGQGSDEIFAGYKYYSSFYFYELMKQWRMLTLARELVSAHNWYAMAMLSFQLLPTWGVKYFIWEKFLNTWIDATMLREVKRVNDPRWQAMSLDEGLRITISQTSLPQLLTLEDKNSMRWSIETRIPFLDFHVVEAAMGCDSSQKLKNKTTKVIFREAMKEIVPSMILDRKDKIGFHAPSNELFREGQVVAFSKNIIYSDSFRSRQYWNWEKVTEIFDAHTKGKTNAGDTIWKWLNTELWLRRYFGNKT
jgi:asparagine synthase (glutamine-hydrolysing)